MATRTTQSGVKRSVDADDDASNRPPAKRFKSNSKRPQSKAATAQDEKRSPKPEPSCNPNLNPKDNSQESENQTKSTLTLTESTGDIFTAPPGTLLVHACNCEGSWGAGIAAAFRKTYPSAFKTYSTQCFKNGNSLFSKALLIPPNDPQKHFVGCLFTSRSKGKKKDSPEKILEATGPAMRDLLRQVREYVDREGVKEVRMCKINSGLFGVPWGETRKVLEGIEVDEGGVREVKVISREE